MAYIVLARRYRPQVFDEVIGQDHITEILKKAITSGRLSHAFLFCGPRGIGKTSCARILAKSLNCQKGPTLKPCGQCVACQEITKANSFDVIEIDGASNRGIDEIRTLRENVKFAPSYGRFKIYIVDEVHMLTTEAFNALLKTLEEPPEHVKFIFATTAPNKIPATIISRCQRFDFRRISIGGIEKTLKNICKTEKLKIDDEALFAIAKAASGSLRDALSILDQMSALAERQIKSDDVFSMLGMVEVEHLFELSDCLARKDCANALDVLDKIINKGKDIKQLYKDLTEHFRHLMVIKVGGKSLGRLVEYPVATKERLLTQTKEFSLKEILTCIETFVSAQEMARVMDSERIPLEVSFAKLTYTSENDALPQQKIEREDHCVDQKNVSDTKKPSVPWPSAVDVLTNQKGVVDFGAQKTGTKEKADVPPEFTLEHVQKSWDAITHAISRIKMSVATFLQEGAPYAIKGHKLIISFPERATFHKETLEDKKNRELIEKVLSEKLKTKIRIELRVIDDHKPQEDEPLIKTTLETFKGKVVNKWHQDK